MFRSADGLAKRVHDFNCHPATYAHPSWFEALIAPRVFNMLRANARGEARLSRVLLSRHDLEDELWYDFSQKQWRFALLPADVLLKLVDCCGLLFQHRTIAATVDSSARAMIKDQIGEGAYLFALKRAPLILGHLKEIESPAWDGHDAFSVCIRRTGLAYLLSHFHDAPMAIAARLTFKFSQTQIVEAVSKVSHSDGWPIFNRILRHELDPKWQTLFS